MEVISAWVAEAILFGRNFLCYGLSVSLTGSCTNDWPKVVVMFMLFFIIFNPLLFLTVDVHHECILSKGVACSIRSRFGLSREKNKRVAHTLVHFRDAL